MGKNVEKRLWSALKVRSEGVWSQFMDCNGKNED